MTVNYTTNLALGQPVTGTESGTWGDDVNNSVTSYLDIAIAGGLAITVTTTDVTLTLTQGTSSATNIGSTTAQYAILNVSGAMTAARNLILPSSSRQYVINNNTTGGFALTVKGSATSGVTMVNGESAHVFWNGSDYAKLSNAPGGAGTFTSITNSGLTSGRVVYSTTGGLETDSANLTFDGTNLTLAGGTANGVAYLNGSKVLTSGSAIIFDGTNLAIGQSTATNKLTVVSTDSTSAVGSSTASICITNTYTGAYGYSSDLIYRLGGGAGTKLAGISGIYTANGGELAFYTYNGTTFAERVRLTSTSLYTASGVNVALGTSSPAANNRLTLSDTNSSKLTITGGSTQNGMVFNAVSTASQYYIAAGVNLLATGDKGFLIYDVTNANAKFFVEDVAGETRTQATTFLSYYIGASVAMRIDSNGVGIGTTANASAILDAQSTTKGVRMPNMTTTQKNAISSPAAGLMVFDTTLAKLCVYSGSAWQTITSI